MMVGALLLTSFFFTNRRHCCSYLFGHHDGGDVGFAAWDTRHDLDTVFTFSSIMMVWAMVLYFVRP
jgi:hypothetical protein